MLETLTHAIFLDRAVSMTEVQISLCETQSALVDKTGLQASQLKKRVQTYFIESSDLFLYKNNWVIRIRVNLQKNEAEIALKKNKMQAPFGDCEYDLHGSESKLACKIVTKTTVAAFEKARDENDWSSLLSDEQNDWLTSNGIFLSEKMVFAGAFNESSYRITLGQQNLTLDFSSDNRSQYNEISVRVPMIDASNAQQELLNYAHQKNLNLCADQSFKMTLSKLKSFFGLP